MDFINIKFKCYERFKFDYVSRYPLNNDMNKKWFIKYSNPSGGAPLKKYVLFNLGIWKKIIYSTWEIQEANEDNCKEISSYYIVINKLHMKVFIRQFPNFEQ